MTALTLTRSAALACAVSLALQMPMAARGQQPANAAAPTTFAIRGGTVLTITGGVIQNGTVLVRDGKIAAVGANVTVPPGVQVVDATGKFVAPGIVDAHQHIALDSINEGATTVSSMTGTDDVLDPTDIDIYRDLAGGVTTANILHGSANPIGGKNTVIKMRWGKTKADDLVVRGGAPPGIKFALGENPKDLRQGFRDGPLRYPVTRMGVEYVIRDALHPRQGVSAHLAGLREATRRRRGRGSARRDLQLEPLVEVLEGKRLVHAHCYRADEILMLIRLAEEMGFKIATFQHVLEGYKVREGNRRAWRRRLPHLIDSWGVRPEMGRSAFPQPRRHDAKGVPCVTQLRRRRALAPARTRTPAKAVKWGGVTRDEAMAMITINPAKQLKIDGRVGSIRGRQGRGPRRHGRTTR